MVEDGMTRTSKGTNSEDANEIVFDNPERALIPGEWFTIAGQSTEYKVLSSTNTTASITPVLSDNVADNTKITRFDKYSIMSIEDIYEELRLEENQDDVTLTFVYKKSLQARMMLESMCGFTIRDKYNAYDEKMFAFRGLFSQLMIALFSLSDKGRHLLTNESMDIGGQTSNFRSLTEINEWLKEQIGFVVGSKSSRITQLGDIDDDTYTLKNKDKYL